MSPKKRYLCRRGKYLVFAGLVALAICVLLALIYTLSAQQGNETTELSRRATRFLCRFIFFDFEDYSQNLQLQIVSGLNRFIRKLAHFIAFAGIGFFTYLCGYFFWERRGWRLATSFIISAIAAIADEFHQQFVDGREALFTDVLLDCCGAMVGIIFCIMVILTASGIYRVIIEKSKI